MKMLGWGRGGGGGGGGLKSMNLPLSWFVYERIELDLIDPRVLKIEHGLHLKILESAPFTVRR